MLRPSLLVPVVLPWGPAAADSGGAAAGTSSSSAAAAGPPSTSEVQTDVRPVARPQSAKPLSYFDKLVINTHSRQAGQMATGGEHPNSARLLTHVPVIWCTKAL